MSMESPNPAFDPTGQYDEVAINRARNILNSMPENVGPYRILERLGGGGMGEVYRAEQRSPMRREVALKFIKLGMDTKQVIARFEAERQALALMDHPHIAKVFDAGTDDTGRPYFVMEYVKGKPITEYADQNHLSISERLELFEQVCQAVQHAHHKGVIHRDLKPGNVLVSTQDGKPFSKVIDFGIAKATAQRLTDHTLFTEHAQFVGTPQYMSPEQAEGSVDIDTRADVYSLGVMLYELLTGSTPFSNHELKAAAFDQIKKLIIEVDPPKPSTRLTISQPTLATLAASRRIEPKRLGTLVRGELDWIVMKSLEKDRKRRYESPTSLAHDINAHLKGEPVQAAPPSTGYRIQKFMRKHRGPVIATALVAGALIAGIIGTTAGYYRAEQNAALERQANERERLATYNATSQRDVAIQARKQALAAKEEAVQAKNMAIAAQDQTELALGRGFVRPLVSREDDLIQGELHASELQTAIELAALKSDTAGLRMLGEAIRDSSTTFKLLNRAEVALVAAIGLNPGLRRRALTLLGARLDDKALSPDHRAGIALIMLTLLDQGGPESTACLRYVREALATEMPAGINLQENVFFKEDKRSHIDNIDLEKYVSLLEPSIAAQLFLIQSSAPKMSASNLFDLGEVCVSLSIHSDSDDAVRFRRSASDAFLRATAKPASDEFAWKERWSPYYPIHDIYIDKTAAAGYWAKVDPIVASQLGRWVSNALTARLSDSESFDDKIYDLTELVERFDLFAANMEPADVARVYELACEKLHSALSESKDAIPRERVNSRRTQHLRVDLLAKCAVHLTPEGLERVWSQLLAVLSNPNLVGVDDESEFDTPYGLAELSAHLQPDAAKRGANRLLTVILDLELDPHNRFHLIKSLAALSKQLDSETAAKICSLVPVTWRTVVDPDSYSEYRHPVMLALSERLEPTTTARFCELEASALIDSLAGLKQETYGEYERYAAKFPVMAATSAHLHPEAAIIIADKLLIAFSDPKRKALELYVLAKGISSLSKSLEPVAAARIGDSASDILVSAIADSKWSSDERQLLLHSLALLAAKLGPVSARRAFAAASDAWLTALCNPKVEFEQRAEFAMAFATLAASQTRTVAATRCKLAADQLLSTLSDPNFSVYDLATPVRAIAAIAEYLEPDSASQVCQSAVNRLSDVIAKVNPLETAGELDLVVACCLLRKHLGLTGPKAIARIAFLLRCDQQRIERSGSYFPPLTDWREMTIQLDSKVGISLAHELFALTCATLPDSEESEIQWYLRDMQRREPHYAKMGKRIESQESLNDDAHELPLTGTLTTQEIVEWLKFPAVIVPRRRDFLDLLECRYGRRFGNHWEFVEYAEAEKLGLDFTSRMKRPDPQAILQNIHKLLDEDTAKP